MKYIGIPMAMWAVFAKSFRTQLTSVFRYDAATAKEIARKAKPKYKEIIAKLPEFENGDHFKMNIVGCAMLGAFILCMPKQPDAEVLTVYYENAQMTPLMKWFCRQSGKAKFTPKDIARMKATADLKAADRNPYSWNMDFYEYSDGSGYEGRFSKCGICRAIGTAARNGSSMASRCFLIAALPFPICLFAISTRTIGTALPMRPSAPAI